MSYQQAIEAAGATVHEFKEFGSYQGDWFALVTINNELGWISGSFGSCSHCDAFQAEFGWHDEDYCDAHSYNHNPECLGCQKKKVEYTKKLADFGRTYVEGTVTAETLLKELDERSEWDSESQEAATWIRQIESRSKP